MDRVFIRGLDVETRIGVYDWERQVRQRVRLDLEMAQDIARAAQSDDLATTLDYREVAERISDFVGGSDFLLVEALAEAVARLVREEFQVSWLRLRLAKPGALADAQDVGVIIERGERP